MIAGKLGSTKAELEDEIVSLGGSMGENPRRLFRPVVIVRRRREK